MLTEAQLQENIQRLEQECKSLQGRIRFFSILRISLFLIAIILLVFFANARYGLGIWLLVLAFPPLFAWLVNRHGRLRLQYRLCRGRRMANENDLLRLKRQLSSLPDGAEFLESEHPYAADLDVFGKHSLFALLNRTATAGGATLLANWLLKPAPIEELRKRQEAVQELQNQHNWRHSLEAAGTGPKAAIGALEKLFSWFRSENRVLQKPLYQTAFISLPLISLALLLAYFFADWSFGWILLAMAVNGALIFRLNPYTQSVQQATQDSLDTLDAYTLLFKQLEESNLQAELLQQLKQQLQVKGDRPASTYLRELSQILHGLDSRGNVFYQLLNLLFLLDLYWLRRAERWKLAAAAQAPGWLEAIHQTEALCSLAGFAALEKEAVFPSFSPEAYCLEAEALAHPLLKPAERVTNNFSLKGSGTIALITGSNMAGKSTFLRTLGLNVVLGLSGAPVCAQSCLLSRMQVFTSMRTQDSLEESASAFYSELRRIQQLLALSGAWDAKRPTSKDERLLHYASLPPSPIPVFFLLDEVLKGTNSRDRHLGAAALVRQLQKAGSSGLVSTHDLSLGQLGEAGIANYSFNSYIKDGELVFPYKLEEGLCHSFNASQLMARMGIALPDEPPANQAF